MHPLTNAYLIHHFLLHLIIRVEFCEKYKLSKLLIIQLSSVPSFHHLHEQICTILSYQIGGGELNDDLRFGATVTPCNVGDGS